jgi:hypothetical protein
MSLVLLVGAGLMVQSFRNVQKLDLGYNTKGLLTMQLSMSRTRYPRPQALDAHSRQIIARLQSLPGVESVAAIAELRHRGPPAASAGRIHSDRQQSGHT